MIKKATKPLTKSNPYLHDPKDRQTQFITAALTSTSIEGVSFPPSQLKRSLKRTTKRK